MKRLPRCPKPAEVDRASRVFAEHEGRDAMYRVATYLLRRWWRDYPRMVDALKVLLLTWNGAFYRYGPFDEWRLEWCLRQHWRVIDSFRGRNIENFKGEDHIPVTRLFNALLQALRIK